jgi:hypothetical protein
MLEIFFGDCATFLNIMHLMVKQNHKIMKLLSKLLLAAVLLTGTGYTYATPTLITKTSHKE